MTAISNDAEPAGRRIEALDFVRGAALFGILLMNITAFGLPYAYESPAHSGGVAEGANLWAWVVTQVGFEGTQRALFSVLFGAGVILLTDRLSKAGRTDVADIYFRRTMWLIAFGLVDAYLFLWFGDILYAYGVIGMFLFVFRNMRAKWLIGIGLAALLLNSLLNLNDRNEALAAHAGAQDAAAARAQGRTPTPEQTAAAERWQELRLEHEPSPEMIRRDVALSTSDYFSVMRYVAGVNLHVQTWYFYRHMFLDAIGMMLIGMALFRLGVLTLERPTRFYLVTLAIGYSVGLSVNILETRTIIASGFSALAFYEVQATYDLGRLAVTMGHLAALLLFVRLGALARLRRAVAAVGRMALTSYLTHSIVCGILFVGFGLYNQLQRYELYYVVAAIWIAQLVISPLWLRYFRFGPAEWLWRWLTYLKRPPLRRMAAARNPTVAATAAAE